MKKIIFTIALFFPFLMFGQKFTETITKELTFSKTSKDNHLTLQNINGSIEVEGYHGSTIQLEIAKTITAKTQKRLDQGIQEIQVGVEDEGTEILVYMDSPCTEVKLKLGDDGKYYWQTQSNNCRWDTKYHFNLNYKLKIPHNLNITLSTINNGDIELNNVKGDIKVNNINGSIALTKVEGAVDAHTINGTLDVEYAKNPTKDSRYYSLNGDINAHFKKGLSAQMSFESFNGDFYTNIDDVKMLPTKIKKTNSKNKGKGIKYKVGGKSKMQIRNGKTHLDFETFNGNAYIKEF